VRGEWDNGEKGKPGEMRKIEKIQASFLPHPPHLLHPRISLSAQPENIHEAIPHL
jgi:hypothetical protein